jgi:hypothetical protein
MSVKKTIYYLSLISAVLSSSCGLASAVTISQSFSSFSGNFDSVTLSIGGRQLSTGEILASQNPNLPSVVTFDTDIRQTTFNLNFLLDFPLLDSLGLDSIPISPFETGSYVVDGRDLVANIMGQGVVGGSSPFAGTSTFFDVQWRITSPLDSPVFLGQIESEFVTICPPSSDCVQTSGTGEASGASSPVPEPETIFGNFLAIAAIGYYMRRKRKRTMMVLSINPSIEFKSRQRLKS